MATNPTDSTSPRGMARPVNDDLFAQPAANLPTIGAAGPLTMSSREIAELTEKRHDHVLRDVETMLAALGDTSPQFWGELPDSYGRPQRVALLPKREAMILVSGYSVVLRARIIDRWQELEGAAARPLTQIEVLLQSVQLLASVEREQRAQAAILARLDARIEEVGDAQLLTECPSAAESITAIRGRIAARHGLSARVVDFVMRQHPNAPKPAGMVRNQREEAQGATYAVYWRKDVTALFDHFAKGAVPVPGTANAYTHPMFEGGAARFTIRRKP